jgi:hypothetical protein
MVAVLEVVISDYNVLVMIHCPANTRTHFKTFRDVTNYVHLLVRWLAEAHEPTNTKG